MPEVRDLRKIHLSELTLQEIYGRTAKLKDNTRELRLAIQTNAKIQNALNDELALRKTTEG
jgi:hypothetical protein